MSSLVTCSDVIRFWETGGGGLELRKTTNVAAAATNSCCWNHNGQVVATAGDNGCITVLKLSGSIVPAGVLSAHERPILGIAFSSKSRKLAAGGNAGVVEVWDLKRNNSRVTMRGHRGPVTCVSFFDRDSCVAAGDERGKVVLHRVADAPSDDEASATLPPAGGYASVTGLSMASAAAGPATLGVSYADGGVRLWDTGSRACVREMKGKHRGAAAGIVFHPHNPSLVATVGHDGVVHCTDVRVAHKDGVLKSNRTDAPLTCASFHHEGLMLAVGASDGTARLIDLRTAREVGGPPKKAYAGPSPPSGGVRAVAFQRHPPTRAAATTTTSNSTSSSTTPAAPGGGGSTNGGSSTGGTKISASGSSRTRPVAVAGAGAAGSSSSWDLKKAGGGSGSGRPKQMTRENGGSGGVNGGGVNGGRGYGEGSGGRRRPSPMMTTPAATSVNHADLAGTAPATAVAGLVEDTPYPPHTHAAGPSSSGSTQQQQQQHHHQQQPAAEHTSSSKGNGDYYYAPTTAAGAVVGGRLLGPGEVEDSSTLPQRPHHQEPYGFSSTAAAAAAGAGRDSHQSFATPPREQEEATPTRWGGDARGGGGENGTARTPLLAGKHGDAAAAAGRSSALPVPPPVARGRPDSSSPERVAAGFHLRSRENGTSNGTGNGTSNGGGGGGMATGEGRQWEDQHSTTAYSTNHGQHDESNNAAAVLSTPESRGARQVDARAAGGGSSRHGGGGDGHTGNGFSSPARAPRKHTVHSGAGRSTGDGPATVAAAAAVMAAVESNEEVLVKSDFEGAAAGPAVVGGGGGRVVSLDRSVLEQVLSSHVTGLREELRQELRNLHVDMLRQFHSLQDEQSSSLSGFEERLGGLVAENQALRAENDRLRRVY